MQGQARARVRPVEGEGDGGVLLAEQLPRLVPRVVEAGAGPPVLRVEVVRLPGHVGQDQQQVGGVAIADGERYVRAVPAVRRGQHRDVRADAPQGGDLEPPGEPPVVAGDRAVGGEGRGLHDAGEAGAGGDLGGAVAAVVADAVDVDGELLGRVDRDVEVDRLPRRHGSRRGEALDLLVHVVGGARAAARSRRGDTGARSARRRGVLHIPGDHLSGVVEVVLAPAQPRDRALAERVRHGVRVRTRFPPANVPRPHAAPLPRSPESALPRPLRIRRPRPAHHITHALRHRSSRIDGNGVHGSRWSRGFGPAIPLLAPVRGVRFACGAWGWVGVWLRLGLGWAVG